MEKAMLRRLHSEMTGIIPGISGAAVMMRIAGGVEGELGLSSSGP